MYPWQPISHYKAWGVFQSVLISANNEDIGQKFLPDTYDHKLKLKKKPLKAPSSRSRQGYIGLARCCYISKTGPDKCLIIFK